MTAPEEAFDAVAEALLAEPGTREGTGFGTNPGITVEGKIAAMLVGGRLVVKLPAQRCREVIDGGDAAFLQMGRRTMREWVAVGAGRAPDWVALAREALVFVRPRG
jgi:hypothetical protein